MTVEGGEVTITNSYFNDNSATEKGGAAYVSAGTLKLIGCQLSRNVAPDGGAIAVVGGSFEVTDSTLTANNATSSGGALFLSGGKVQVGNTPITGNRAVRGGGFFVEKSSSTLLLHDKCVLVSLHPPPSHAYTRPSPPTFPHTRHVRSHRMRVR